MCIDLESGERNEQTGRFKLANKVALVTGGSRGLAQRSRNVWLPMEQRGHHICEGTGAASAVVEAIERDGGKAIAILADAADVEAVAAAVERPLQTFGRSMCW